MAQTPPVSHAVRIRPGRRHSLKQTVEMQQVLYEEVTTGNHKLSEKAQAARAWEALEVIKRKLRGLPDLRPIDKPKPKQIKSTGPSESPS
jgi:hypothetical protein